MMEYLKSIVSIQLVSPASGDLIPKALRFGCTEFCFHSISFPSEWGPQSRAPPRTAVPGFHSISFPSEWGLCPAAVYQRYWAYGFHSISFPSEWGLQFQYQIPMISPCFHSISFPSEWGLWYR